jgi:hypothetical protein
MDDDPALFTNRGPWETSKGRLKFDRADPTRPVDDALERLQQDRNREVVAVLSDSFDGSFSHIRRLRSLRPDLLIAVHSGGLTDAQRNKAREAGANLCIAKGASLREFWEEAAKRFFCTPSKKFWDALPRLLETEFGAWVVFTTAGHVYTGKSENDCYQWSQQEGLLSGEYVIGQVIPDLLHLEVTQGV